MVQLGTAQSITIQLTHDLVAIGPYRLAYWEAARGLPITCHATVGVGPGHNAVYNLNLQPRFEYFVNTTAPIMFTELPAVAIPGVTSLAPVVVDIPAAPIYPGLARLRITATAGATQIMIHSGRGINYEFDNWFYVIEREAAFLVALALSRQQ